MLMWIMMSGGFLSVVRKYCAEDELLVRARRPGDIEKVFPDAKVNTYPKHDYLYAAIIRKAVVAEAIATEVRRIDYERFKPSVADEELHAAYFQVWDIMATIQR
jgi:hypothetical protein